MSKYHLSLAELIDVLRKHNVSMPGGKIIVDGKEVLLRTDGEITSVEKAELIAVRGNDAGGYLPLGEVAKVKKDFAPAIMLQNTDGKKSVNLVVVKRESADAITLVDKVEKIIADYGKQAPNISFSLINDYSYYVKRRLNVLVNNGWMGIILVIITIFIFMSSRAAFVTAIGLPIAFLATFLMMDLSGITINLVTMFGLIIVLGMVVDDGIVVAENVFRLREEGMSPYEAAVQGAYQVWKPVTTAVLTTIAAFLPLMMMTGMIGKFVKFIPIIVMFALVASLVEVFLVLPSHMCEIERLPKHGWHWNRDWQNRVRAIYKRLLHALIQHRYKMASAFLILFAVALAIYLFIPFVLFPSKGIEAFFIRARGPVGTSLETTAKMLEPVEKVVASLPKSELKNFVTNAGLITDNPSDPFGEVSSNVGQIAVYLTPITDRDRETDEIMDDVREKLKGLNSFEELTVDSVRPGPPVGKAVELNVSGDDLDALLAFAKEIKTHLETRKGVKDVKIDLRPGKNERRITIDEAKAARAGISVQDVALAIRAAFEGIRATTVRRGDEETYIRVRLPETQEAVPGALPSLLVPTKTCHLVPYRKITRIDPAQGLLRIRHFQRRRTIMVSANIDERVTTSISENEKVIDLFKDKIAKTGAVLTAGGEWEETKTSVQNLKFAFIGALMLIFLILAFQFQSVVQPFIVMVAIPYGFIGVSIAFLFHGEPKSFLALMGAVGLAGVVVNDSIVMVDFINKEIKKGTDRIDAIVKAASIRLRPIVLTTLTTVFGLMPVAYGLLGFDPFLRPMALAMAWGLLVATTFTLLFTPCVYAIVDDLRKRLKAITPNIRSYPSA